MAKEWRFVLRSELLGEVELIHQPQDWRNRETKLVRSMKRYGISLEISSPFVFVKDGYHYVKNVFNRLGYNSQVLIDVFQWDRLTRRYVSYFSGELIMKSIDIGDSSLSVQATPNSIEKLLKDREKKEVDITTRWTMDNAIQPEVEIIVGNLASHSRIIPRKISAQWTESRGYSLTPGRLLQIGFDQLAVDEMPGWISERATIDTTEVFPILKVQEYGDYTFDVAFVIQTSTNNGDELEFFYRKNNETPVAVSTVFSTVVVGPVTYYLFTVTCSDTIALVPGDQLYFYAVSNRTTTATLRVGGSGGRPESLDPDRWILSGETTFTNIASTGIMAFELCEKLLQTMLGAEVLLYSAALGRTDLGYVVNAKPGMNLICSGAGLAGKGSGFKTSFSKVFSEGLAPLYNLGIDVTKATDGSSRILIEEIGYFFSQKVGVKLVGISELRKRVAEDLIYSEVTVGFTKYQSELGGGGEDPHTSSAYLVPGRFVDNTLDIKSQLIASSWKIEEQRRNTTESKQEKDNDLYVINVKPFAGPVFLWEALQDENYDSVDGVTYPDTLFNLDLIPSRVIRRWGPNLAACFYRGNPDLIRWSASESESDLETQVAGEDFPVKERESINSTELPAPLWLPEIYEFTAKLTAAEDRQLIMHKYDVVEVDDTDGNKYYGYLLERSRVEKNETQFTLLRANYNG